jgi:RimJ/RimL family protein N-acetyltransferase
VNAVAAQPIPTRRLTLVPVSPEHADEMAAVLADPDLYAFTGGSPPTREELRARYERWTAGSPDPAVSWCNWVIKLRSPRCLTGTVQATISSGDESLAEVAWVVGTPWQGQGIATEAARALISWLGLQSVHTTIAHIHPRHQASAAVAAAAGLTPTGQVEDGEMRWLLKEVGLPLPTQQRQTHIHERWPTT